MDERTFSAPKAHAAEFLPAIDALCRTHGIAPGEIRFVYVSCGPGSFTGLRIGVTAAKMIALATKARVIAIPTLEVTAQNASEATPPPDQAAVILDAKRGRVYAATFARQGVAYVATCDAAEVDPATFLSTLDRSWAVLGEGVSYHRDAVTASGLRVLPEALFRPRAATVYRLGFERAKQGRFDHRRSVIPIYIRRPEAEEVWERRHIRPG